MTINELAQNAGVTVRTIRYYVEQGLLPPPAAGYPAEYTDEHLRRLALIRRLKDQYLPLDEIRSLMDGTDLAQVEDVLPEQAPAKSAAPHPIASAGEYIAQLLNRATVLGNLGNLKQQAPPAPQPAPAAAPAPSASPAPALPPPPAAMPSPAVGPPVDAYLFPGRDQVLPRTAARTEQAAGVQKEALEKEAPEPAAPASTWQRIVLAPGLELHHVVPVDARLSTIIARLVEAVRQILESVPEQTGE